MPSARSAEHRRALAMLVLTNFFWGLSFPVVKALTLLHARLLPEAGTWFSTIYTVAPRFVLATGLVGLLQPDCWRVTSREIAQGLIIGGFAAMGMLLQNDGLQFTSASTSAFLTQFSAMLIPIWIALRSRRDPGGRVWTCCALVLAGVAVLGRFDWREFRFGRGEWETLLSSFFFMGQILTLDRKDFAQNRPDRITFVMFATQAILFTVLAGMIAPSAHTLCVPWTSPAWLALTVILTVVCTYGSFSLMNRWQPKITATEAGLIYCIEPIFGSAMALVLPAIFSRWADIDYANESTTWTLLVGGGLITLANGLLQLKPPVRDPAMT